MLLEEGRFGDFTRKQICDTSTDTEALLALSCASRTEVDELVAAAVAAGGKHAMDLLVEASGKETLSGGMKSVAARLARAVNRVFRRKGPVLFGRYHLRVLRTPREVRNALAYYGHGFYGFDAAAEGYLRDDEGRAGRRP